MSAEQLECIRREVETCPRLNIVKPSDLLFMPRTLKTVLNRAFRDGKISTADLALALELDPPEAETIARLLVQKGYLQPSPKESGFYIARFGGQGNRSGRSPLDLL